MKNKITAIKVIFELNNNPEQSATASFEVLSNASFEMLFCNNAIPSDRMKVYVAARRGSKLVLDEEELNLL